MTKKSIVALAVAATAVTTTYTAHRLGMMPIPVGFFGSSVVISSFNPSSGCPGDGVLITGGGFSGATAVTFNGVPAASFVVQSPTQITTIVPNGATTGKLRVTTPKGTATSGINFTLTACLFTFNLASTSPPAGIVAARPGPTEYAQNTAATVLAFTSGQGYVCEDKGDGAGPACWAHEGIENDAPSYTDFTNVGWTNAGVTVSNGVADPAGGAAGSNLQTTVLGACGNLTVGPVGPSDQTQGIITLWYESGTPAPSPNDGLLGVTTGGPAPWTLLAPTASWTRGLSVFDKPAFGNRQNFMQISPASYNDAQTAVCNVGSTGGINAWGAQTASIAGFGIVPTCSGSGGGGQICGPATLQVAAGQLGNMLTAGGDWHIKISAIVDSHFTSFQSAGIEASAPWFWSMVTADGVTDAWVGSQTIWSQTINGVAFGALNLGFLNYTLAEPTLITEEIFSFPGSNTSGVNFFINGFRSFNTSISGVGITMHNPTSFYLGSNGGSSNFMDLRFTDLARVSNSTTAAKGVMLGDSLTSVFASLTSVGPWIYNVGQARTQGPIVGYQFPGETCPQQQARWDSSAQKGDPSLAWVFVLCGNNDIAGGATDVQTAAALQAIVNDVHGANPTAKIVISPNLPTNCAYNVTQQGYFANYNADVLGTGPNPITDPGGSVLIRMNLWTQLSGGATGPSTYCYLPQYDSGDHIHETDPARQIIGSTGVPQSIAKTLIANGLL